MAEEQTVESIPDFEQPCPADRLALRVWGVMALLSLCVSLLKFILKK